MNLDATLDQLAHDPYTPVDLATLALQLACDEYPFLDPEAYRVELAGLAHEARPFLGRSLLSQVTGLCRFLFHEVGFRGNTSDYYDPRNSYLNEVMDRHLGIPITLSLVTMAVGQELGLDIQGIGLPGHFVVMAEEDGQRLVFDPYNGGRPLNASDCIDLVRDASGLDVELTIAGLEPAAPGAIVVRMLTNLKGCYLRLRDFRRAARVIRRLRQAAPHDWTQARDLGACYLHAGQPGKAIDALNLYLNAVPDAVDRETVTKLLTQARAEVARWN